MIFFLARLYLFMVSCRLIRDANYLQACALFKYIGLMRIQVGAIFMYKSNSGQVFACTLQNVAGTTTRLSVACVGYSSAAAV